MMLLLTGLGLPKIILRVEQQTQLSKGMETLTGMQWQEEKWGKSFPSAQGAPLLRVAEFVNP